MCYVRESKVLEGQEVGRGCKEQKGRGKKRRRRRRQKGKEGVVERAQGLGRESGGGKKGRCWIEEAKCIYVLVGRRGIGIALWKVEEEGRGGREKRRRRWEEKEEEEAERRGGGKRRRMVPFASSFLLLLHLEHERNFLSSTRGIRMGEISLFHTALGSIGTDTSMIAHMRVHVYIRICIYVYVYTYMPCSRGHERNLHCRNWPVLYSPRGHCRRYIDLREGGGGKMFAWSACGRSE